MSASLNRIKKILCVKLLYCNERKCLNYLMIRLLLLGNFVIITFPFFIATIGTIVKLMRERGFNAVPTVLLKAWDIPFAMSLCALITVAVVAFSILNTIRFLLRGSYTLTWGGLQHVLTGVKRDPVRRLDVN